MFFVLVVSYVMFSDVEMTLLSDNVDNKLEQDENILTGGGVILGGMVVICDMILTVIAVILNLFLVISMRNSKVNKLASFLWIFQ